MSTLNIAGLTPVDDPSYRYKMPHMQAKVEGRGNGIKTVLVNVNEVALSLCRDAPEVTKFFGCELGAQTTYAADTDRAIVNGAHTASSLQAHLCKYIENFVLCRQCRLPETRYSIKGGVITQKCAACGAKSQVDMTHKLTTFILAQHKKNKEAAAKDEKKGSGGKKDKKKDAANAAAAADDGEAHGGGKEEKKKKKKSSEEPSSPTGDGTEKKKKSSKSKSHDVSNVEEPLEGNDGAVEEDESDKKMIEDCIARFKSWLVEHGDADVPIKLEELRALQTIHALRPADRIIIYIGACFTVAPSAAVTNQEIIAHKPCLVGLASSTIQQRHLIAAFEWFCGAHNPFLKRYFPVILKQLYDEDIVEEDVLFDWAGDMTRNEFTASDTIIEFETLEQLKASADPFIKWLQEAGEEGDDDDDEEGDEEDDDDEEGK